MKVKVTIDDGNGKTAELEIAEADKTTQAVLIQSIFELFNVDTSFLEKEQKMNKIEKAYAKFFDEVDSIESINKSEHDPKEIEEQMTSGFEQNSRELLTTYMERNDQPEFVRTGIKIRNGKNFYRLRYVCYACFDKSTLYVPQDYRYVWCRRCSHQLEVELATNKPFGARDSFGNFLVAGDFRDRSVVDQEE